MPNIISGKHFNNGGREVYEDRVQTADIETAGGLSLSVAIVADGVGGRDKGERAAQLTIDTILEYLQNSPQTDIPQLLTSAVEEANRRVYKEASDYKGENFSTTVSVAAIHNNERLYIANVGDSRIYLHRVSRDNPKGRLTQLTMDHTYANIMVQLGELSRAVADNNPRADRLMRAIGIKERIPVDIGFYVGTEDYEEATERGYDGLPLRPGDSVLVCSDGLIKRHPRTKELFITEEEICDVLSSGESDQAAKTLISFALGREPTDNISVALLQTPYKPRTQIHRRRTWVIVGVAAAIIAVLVLGLTFALTGLSQTGRELDYASEQATQAAEEAVFRETAVAQTLAALPTATSFPTSTPRPPIAPGQVALFFPGPQVVTEKQMVVSSSPTDYLAVNHTDLADFIDANIFLLATPSEVEFSRVAGSSAEFLLSGGGHVFITSGGYSDGVFVQLRDNRKLFFSVSGSCMAVDYSVSGQVRGSCFEGHCQYSTDFGDTYTSFNVGEEVTLDLATFEIISSGKISEEQAVSYTNSLGVIEGPGSIAANICLKPYLPLPPTPVIVIPTWTPLPPPPGPGYGK